MRGNSPVRFSGEGAPATPLPYPTQYTGTEESDLTFGVRFMRRLAILLLAFISTSSSPHIATHCQAADEDDFRAAIKGWKPTLGDNYKVDPYIRAAQVLQKMGKDEACRLLRTYTKETDSG